MSWLLLIILLVCIVVLVIGVVFVCYCYWQMFIELLCVECKCDDINLEFGCLQLEQVMLVEVNCVDCIVCEKFGMKFFEVVDIVVVCL